MATWLEESRRYREFLINRYFNIYEADRARFIQNNPNLTDEQKSKIINAFKKYPTIDKDIKWGSKDVSRWTYEQFKPYLNKAGKSISQSKKQKLGISGSGLELGKDYLILEQNDKVIAYQPLTYYASRIIASNDTPPKVIGKNSNGNDITGAEWCISQQKSRILWDHHSIESEESFVIICGEDIPTKKVCVTASKNDEDFDGFEYEWVSSSGLNYNIWDFYDNKDNITPKQLKPFVNLDNLINVSYQNYHLVLENHDRDTGKTEKINKEKVINLLEFNSETKRYDKLSDKRIEAKYLIENGKFKYPLGIWKGSFSCDNCDNLTSLEGSPQKVEGSFSCSNCNSLESLEGAPVEVTGDFTCSYCNGLLSLKGASKIIGGSFNCYGCENLKSLEGAPNNVKMGFTCACCNNLTSLEGSPQKVGGSFSCSYCTNLISLKGSPQEVGGSFSCFNCNNISSLEGFNTQIGNRFLSNKELQELYDQRMNNPF